MKIDITVNLLRAWLDEHGTDFIRAAFEEITDNLDETEFEAAQNIGRELSLAWKERDAWKERAEKAEGTITELNQIIEDALAK
jgi:hypothetical protein